MAIRASIDIGSNSILLLVARITSDNDIEVLENISNVTGLGRDLDLNGSFLEQAMTESFAVLESYKLTCHKYEIEPEDIIVTATEASRVAANSKQFYSKVKKSLGIDVTIISGEGEAYYSTMGILFDSSISESMITIMDIGGASTELIYVDTKSKSIQHSFSMPMGAVRVNNWKHEGSLDTKINSILADYQADFERVSAEKLFCVAGTMTSVGSIHLNLKSFQEKEVNGLEFKSKRLRELEAQYSEYSAEQMHTHFPFLGKRAATINAGLYLANRIVSKLGTEDIYISTYGLRYGTLIEGGVKNEYAIDS